MKISYLASPYSHPDSTVRHARFQAVTWAAAWLFRHGATVFCPITHSHPINLHNAGQDHEFSYWAEYDTYMLRQCSSMIVLCLNGWRESVGVTAEIAFCNKYKIPVSLMQPEECGLFADYPYLCKHTDSYFCEETLHHICPRCKLRARTIEEFAANKFS